MISENYRKLNRQLHEENPAYGTSGHKFGQFVTNLYRQFGGTVLDYGCGKQTLQDAVPEIQITGYDPCIPGLDKQPVPHDLVVCTDVMEHIEPEHLDAVIEDLARVTRKALFVTIATRPAKKILADGRNAHLIQEDFRWWLPRFWDDFDIRQTVISDGEIILMGVPRGGIRN